MGAIRVVQQSPAIARLIPDEYAIITNMVAKYYGIRKSTILGKPRHKQVIEARFALISILRERYDPSLEFLGHYIGKRDHTSIIHALRRQKDYCEVDKYYRARFEQCKMLIETIL